MSIENKNLDDYWASQIDGKSTGFPVTGNDARYYEREDLAKQRAASAAHEQALPVDVPIATEKAGPRHRADTPMKGVLAVANRKF